MNRHLDDHEISAAVAGFELEPETAEHLASCLMCRRQVGAMAQLLAERRTELEAEAPNWQVQQQQILDRLPATGAGAARPARRWWRPALAAAAVLVAAVAVTLFYMPHSGVPVAVVADEEIQVEEIFAEVDALLADDTTPGFEALDQLVPGSDELSDYYYQNGAS